MSTLGNVQAQSIAVTQARPAQEEPARREIEKRDRADQERNGRDTAQASDQQTEASDINDEFVQRLLGLNSKLSIEKLDQGNFVYKILDKETGDIIKQFPPEELLEQIKARREASKELLEATEGALVDKRA